MYTRARKSGATTVPMSHRKRRPGSWPAARRALLALFIARRSGGQHAPGGAPPGPLALPQRAPPLRAVLALGLPTGRPESAPLDRHALALRFGVGGAGRGRVDQPGLLQRLQQVVRQLGVHLGGGVDLREEEDGGARAGVNDEPRAGTNNVRCGGSLERGRGSSPGQRRGTWWGRRRPQPPAQRRNPAKRTALWARGDGGCALGQQLSCQRRAFAGAPIPHPCRVRRNAVCDMIICLPEMAPPDVKLNTPLDA